MTRPERRGERGERRGSLEVTQMIFVYDKGSSAVERREGEEREEKRGEGKQMYSTKCANFTFIVDCTLLVVSNLRYNTFSVTRVCLRERGGESDQETGEGRGEESDQEREEGRGKRGEMPVWLYPHSWSERQEHTWCRC